jgi:hypothetical protein
LIDEHIVKDSHILKLNILGCDRRHVLLGTPVIGWGLLLGNSQAPSENPESSATAVERDGAAQPLANGNPENGKQGLLTLPAQKRARPVSKITDATLVMYPQPLLLKSCP